MAARAATERPPPAPTYTHTPLSAADNLLAATITLPPQFCISYALFKPIPTITSPHDAIEQARRSIVSRNASAALLDSLLTSVHIGPEPFIYIFKLSQLNSANSAAGLLGALDFDGLAVQENSFFTPPSISSGLPNADKRNAFTHFYEAIRLRIIDDIVVASSKSQVRRQVKRFKNGFLMSQTSSSSDWEYKPITRPLIFCQLQVHFLYSPEGTPSHLVIHPTLIPTPFLDISRSLPLPAGTPITLLPFGTPAYFLASYTGPTAGLIKQFQPSLEGMGAGEWEGSPKPSSEHPFTFRTDSSSRDNSTLSFIIGWIKVENKQGEDKGITIIYPTKLCLSYMPYSSSRIPLDYIPELPAPLQPSPQAHPALPPISALTQSSMYQAGEIARSASAPISAHSHCPSILTTPTSESLYSFRALTLINSKDLRHVATEVGGYVDAVARERERERERLKRERESGISSSPKWTRTSATTPAAAPTPMSIETSTSSTSFIAPPPSASLPAQSQLQPPPPPPPPAALQPSLSMHHFYPSPPQTAPVTVTSSDKTSPLASTSPSFPINNEPASNGASTLPTPTPSGSLPPQRPPTIISGGTSSGAYDPYSMDSTWPTQSAGVDDNYLDMDIDLDFGGMDDIGMSFGMSMGSMSIANSSSGSTSTGLSTLVGGGPYNVGVERGISGGMEFEDAFTDDDFSFFDRPQQRPAAAQASTAHFPHSRTASGSGAHPLAASALPSGAGMSLPNFGDLHVSGVPGPPSTHANGRIHTHTTQNQQMWTPGAFMDGFTPRTVEHNDSVPPELLPSSPGQGLTPESRSAPATPNVHLEFEPAIKRSASNNINNSVGQPSLWEPIPFAPYHREADGKYAVGKFALPSPPAEEATAASEAAYVSQPASPNGWRFRYDAITDPRIGVVRKLIGVKRKTPFQHTMRNPPKASPWINAHEEWEKPHLDRTEDNEDTKSEFESSEEEDEEEEDLDDLDSPMFSRPTTPPPSYLPLGPTLLSTHFQHTQLLPLSVPLRPPGAAVAPVNLVATNPPASVPTPVSPAAMMGAASEKSRSLEAAAFAVAAEVVENPIWAETWRANAVGTKPASAVWSTDVKAVAQLMQAVPSLDSPVDMGSLFGLDTTNDSKSVQALEAPMISVGKGEAVIQILPPALRFWEKLGLSPKGGRKDISVFVLFEDDGERMPLMQNWLAGVANTYKGKHFGTMTPGKSSSCQVDGLVPLRFDTTFRKTLASFALSLPPSQPTTIIFVILPVIVMTLSSPVLRQILSVSKKILSSHLPCQTAFEFVPDQHILSGLEKTPAYDSALDILASSVYNRILIPVDRLRSRRIHSFEDDKDDLRSYLMAPSFTLARPWYNKVSYVRSAHTSLDVMDRYTLLHVGYHLTACGKWIITCCVDQRGEMYDLGVWLTQSPGEHEGGEAELSDEEYAVKKVWDFAMQFAKKTNVEWRVIFARLGVLSEKEMNAWTSRFNTNVISSQERPPLHHTLVCVVPDASWSFIPSSKSNTTTSDPRPTPAGRSPSSSKQHTIFTDVSATTYAVFPRTHIPISLPPSQSDLGLSQAQSYIPEPATSSSSLPPSAPSPHPQSNTPLSLHTQTTSTTTPSPDPSSSSSYPHPLTFLPLLSSILIRVPHAASSSSISMTSIHLLRTAHSASYTQSVQALPGSSSQVPDNEQLMRDVTRSYYDLGVLAGVRWKLDGGGGGGGGNGGGHRGVPFHLAATDAMRVALDRDWERTDAGVEA